MMGHEFFQAKVSVPSISESLTEIYQVRSNFIRGIGAIIKGHISKFHTSCLTKCSRGMILPIQSQFGNMIHFAVTVWSTELAANTQTAHSSD